MKTFQKERVDSADMQGPEPSAPPGAVGGEPLRRRVLRGAFWSLAGSVINRGLTVAAGIFVARVLVKEQFGEFGIIVSTAAMFQVLAGMGMGMTALKHVAEFRNRDPARAGRILALSGSVSLGAGVLAAVLFFAFAPWLAERTLAAPHLAPLLRIASPLLLFATIDGVQSGALAGFEAFRSLALFQLMGGAISVPLILGGVYCGGLGGAVLGITGSYAVQCGLNHWALRRTLNRHGVPLLFKGCRDEWRVLLSFSLPVMAAGMLGTPVLWACNAMLVNRPDGYAEMAVVNAALYWRALLLFIPSNVNRIITPIVANTLNRSTPGGMARMVLCYVSFNGLITLLSAALIALLSSRIMAAYGSEFVAGKTVLVLFALSTVPAAVVNSLKEFFVALGRAWLYLGFVVFWSAALLVFTYLYVRSGARGLAFAHVAAYAALLIVESVFAVFLLRTLKNGKRIETCFGLPVT